MKFVQFNSESAIAISVSDTVVADILSFGRLEKGWHYGKGQPATRNVVETALSIQAELKSLGAKIIEAFPRTEGSVVVSAISGSDVVDITCRTDEKFNLYVERNDEVILDVEDVKFSEIVAQVRFLEWRGTSRFDYSTPSISLMSEVDSTAQPSNPPQTEFPSLTAYVPSVLAEPNVNTFRTTTLSEFPGLRLYSSDSTSQACQRMNSNKIRLKPATFVTS